MSFNIENMENFLTASTDLILMLENNLKQYISNNTTQNINNLQFNYENKVFLLYKIDNNCFIYSDEGTMMGETIFQLISNTNNSNINYFNILIKQQYIIENSLIVSYYKPKIFKICEREIVKSKIIIENI